MIIRRKDKSECILIRDGGTLKNAKEFLYLVVVIKIIDMKEVENCLVQEKVGGAITILERKFGKGLDEGILVPTGIVVKR